MKKNMTSDLIILTIALSVMTLSATSAIPTTIQVVQDPAKLAQPWASIVLKGDFLITDGKTTAAISASPRTSFSTINYGNPEAAGVILGFLPDGAGKRAGTQIGAPSVQVTGQTLKMGPVTVRQEGGGIVSLTTFEGPDGIKLEVRTRYAFALESRRINVAAEVRNVGRTAVKGFSFSAGANAFQSYSFTPFQGQAFPKLNFRVWQRPDHALGWFVADQPRPSGGASSAVLGAGQTYRASYVLLTGTDPAQMSGRLYALAGVMAEPAAFALTGFDSPAEVVIREPATNVIFYRAFMDKPIPTITVPLPRGTYAVTANFFPAVIERNFRVDAGAGGVGGALGSPASKPLALVGPKIGNVRVSIANGKGKPVPGKVTFIGLAPDRSPYFRPENPVETGRGWENAKNSVFPLRAKPEVRVPAGTYLVTASHGPEFTRESRIVEIFEDENPPLDFRLDQAVNAAGFVSVDPHMHTQNSDGSMLIPERLKSLVAEGVDVAVATDHNFITDYRPDLERLGIGDELAVILGEEITARGGSIHFNAYPVTRVEDAAGGGAVSVADVTPDVLFGLVRAKDPSAIVQINHPRSRGLGYFLTYSLEEKTAADARAPFSTGFDVMEIMNGSKAGGANGRSVEDWFHLLNRGYPVRAVGSSDAHGIDGGEPAYSRTYVMYAGKKGPGLDQAAVVKAIKEGRSFVSNGPIVTVRGNGRAKPGDVARAKKGNVELEVRVESAPWIDASEIRLVVNGERKPPLEMKGGDGKAVRYRGKVELKIDRDAWITVEVRGKGSLYPVVQQRAGGGVADNAAFPYAMTNPIFFDVDGDGKCAPLWAEKVKIK